MASYKKPGGVRNGSMAQEEELARRSNLVWGLPQELYPLLVNDYIYTKDVTFFKNKYYGIIDSFKCDVITMAALNIREDVIPKSYESIMVNKISNMLWTPYNNGCKNIVLSAFGCGVFGNDPRFVANLFKKILDQGFLSLYDNISFAILNDSNSVGSNFEIFKNILS